MRIRVVHETIYSYEQPARGLVQVLRMRPRDHDGQYVRRWRIDPSVDGRLTEREDGYGNIVHWFTPDEASDALVIRVTGEVDTNECHGVVRGSVERLPDPFYLRETDLVAASPEIQAFADSVGAAGDRAVLPTLHRLHAAVHAQV
ncbi:transglutaminase N-terminal domain-containing protein, partial [Methylobacterium trifolii]